MAQTANTQGNSSRALALARRKALSSSGKSALGSSSAASAKSSAATSPASVQVKATVTPAPQAAASRPAAIGSNRVKVASSSSRSASLARRKAMSTGGKTAVASTDRTRTEIKVNEAKTVAASPASDKDCGCGCNGSKRDAVESTAVSIAAAPKIARSLLSRKPKKVVRSDSCKAASLARRKALSTRGKAGISKSGMSSAQTARASNPDLNSRELAKALRDQKSRKGSAGVKKAEPARRMRPARSNANGAAEDAPWKVGASDTSHGQTVTGTMVGRNLSMTGDEASTCRDITGTEYLGADIFKQFCQTEPAKSIQRITSSATSRGNSVTGNQIGRSQKVTGDEPGTCKNVTGTEYVGNNQSLEFCGTETPRKPPLTGSSTNKGKPVTGDNVGRSERVTGDESGANRTLTGTQYTRPDQIGSEKNNAPAKVGNSSTLLGSRISGSMVGRSKSVTGDEAGSCRNVTGDDYLGQEQFQSFCKASPEKTERKVGQSRTFNGESVTGTMTGRSQRVTGNEPGTCKSVTGTPYAGSEQYEGYCEAPQVARAAGTMMKNPARAGAALTGLQPAVGGRMTGDSKGACENISGTPYVGRDQQAEACPAVAAEPGNADFPQMIAVTADDFSVSSPAGEAQVQRASGRGVTGSSYEQGNITGPFGMATGKVTGTEEARFSKNLQPAPMQIEKPQTVSDRPVSRISGEGQDMGIKITGDDWDRGDRVTGTEGLSATRRNPTLRGPQSQAMPIVKPGRDEDVAKPVSKVTGGSGNTDRGALITYSGGARG
jgi:hypothetical protein